MVWSLYTIETILKSLQLKYSKWKMNYLQRYVISCTIWCHLNNLKKREKYPWRSANFSKVAGLKPATLLNLTLLHGCFSRFFKLYKWYQIVQRITNEKIYVRSYTIIIFIPLPFEYINSKSLLNSLQKVVLSFNL